MKRRSLPFFADLYVECNAVKGGGRRAGGGDREAACRARMSVVMRFVGEGLMRWKRDSRLSRVMVNKSFSFVISLETTDQVCTRNIEYHKLL